MTENEKPGDIRLAEYQECLQKKIGDQTGEIWYRGQKSAEWGLQSGSVQRLTATKESYTRQDLIAYHQRLLDQAGLMGLNQESGGRKLSDLELLAKLQHHGAATCLLDFTADFNVALWFACQEVSAQESDCKDGKVFVVPIRPVDSLMKFSQVSTDQLEEAIEYFFTPETQREEVRTQSKNIRQIVRQELDRLRNSGEQVKDAPQAKVEPLLTQMKEFWLWQPEALIGRIISQSSRFIFGPNEFAKLDKDLYERVCFEIEIEEGDKAKLLKVLEQRYGLEAKTVFSDIHGFASINRRGIPYQMEYEDYLQAAEESLNKGNYPDAIKYANYALAKKLKDPNALYVCARAYTFAGKYDKAIQAWTTIILQQPPADVEAWLNRGNAWYEKGEYDLAIADYNEAIRLEPDCVEAWYNRGTAWHTKGEYDKAIADYNEAIRLEEDYASAWLNRGNAWYKKGEYDKAIADYNEAIRLKPDYVEAWYNRGNAWHTKGEYDKAIADYNEAIRLKPDHASAWTNRGVTWRKKGEHDKAQADFEESDRLLKLD